MYWRRSQEVNPLTSKAKELSFAAFVRYFEYCPAVVMNPYTYHFAGADREIKDNGTDGPTLLAAAKHNLSAFDFIGICEKYEPSARLLCGELGWQPPAPLPYENRTGSENHFADIDDRTLELLRERNQLDSELYAYGVALFEAHEQAKVRRAHCPPVSDARLSSSRSGLRWWHERKKPKSFLPFPTPSEKSREAAIEKASATWIPDLHSRVLELAVRFRTKVEIHDLILGLAIFDAAGKRIWGTNTSLEGLDLKNEPYHDCHAVFLLQCAAPTGTYSVTMALHRASWGGIHDHWLDRATCFEVVSQAEDFGTNLFELHQFKSTMRVGSIESRAMSEAQPHLSERLRTCLDSF